MTARETGLEGCLIISPQKFSDERGYFFESFNKALFKNITGIEIDFVQDNQSSSSKGVLRGLHFQTGDYEQAKLVRVISGRIQDVCVDIRPNSPTFGHYFSIILDDIMNEQLFIPRGFAHGFLVLEDNTIVSYKCDNYYNKAAESGIRFDDKTLKIAWQKSVSNIILSPKDSILPSFESLFI